MKLWLKAIVLIVVGSFIADLGYYFFMPDIASLKNRHPAKTSFMEYRERQWQKAGIKRTIQQKWVPLPRISPYVVKAVIIAEDDKFWVHEGFDFDAMQKALEKDLEKRKVKAGGSTISQQLAKNLFLSPSKNPIRKLNEAILTWRLEHNLSKKRIIELYMNAAEWGDGIFGIEMAARRNFGKSSAELTAMEAARLAAVLPNPRRYNPAGLARYVRFRSEKIYSIMVHRGIVIPDYDEVMSEPGTASPENSTIPEMEPGTKIEQHGDQEPGAGENNILGGEPDNSVGDAAESRSD